MNPKPNNHIDFKGIVAQKWKFCHHYIYSPSCCVQTFCSSVFFFIQSKSWGPMLFYTLMTFIPWSKTVKQLYKIYFCVAQIEKSHTHDIRVRRWWETSLKNERFKRYCNPNHISRSILVAFLILWILELHVFQTTGLKFRLTKA